MPENMRVGCPLCGWWRTVPYGTDSEGNVREVRFDKVDLDNPMLRLERLTGAGRGSRNAKIELVEGKRLEEMPAEFKEQIRNQCHKILARLGE